MISPETPIDVLADIVEQLKRIANSLEALSKREAFNVVIDDCPTIRIRSN